MKQITLLAICLLAFSCSTGVNEDTANTQKQNSNLTSNFKPYTNEKSETILDVSYGSHPEQIMNIYLPLNYAY